MDEVLRQVVQVFAEEVKEQAQRISSALMLMESSPASVATQIEEVYRQAHSLKGSSSSLGVSELEALAHNLEEALIDVRRGAAPFLPAMADLGLRAMDAARLRADGLVADTDAGRREVEALAEELRLLTTTRRPSSAPEVAPDPEATTAPAPAPPPAADSDGETVRVASSRLIALERRLDELRGVHGRLDQRAVTAQAVVHAIERLWQELRAFETRQADAAPERSAVTPDALYQIMRQLSALRRDLLDDAELAQSNALELDENLRAMRLVPALLLQEPLQRALRDACRRTDKEAQLDFVGGEVQIDRRLLEALKSPLLHLVRNAVDHGIESRGVREAVGKPLRAAVTVSVEQRGHDVVLEVGDDGRGVDHGAVRARAVERGIASEREAAALLNEEVHELLFRPGFTTAETVTELSGRGVGLDVVRDAVFRLHGRVELRSEIGRGATFTLSVPLTVAASELMLVEENGRPFAIPQSSLERILRVHSNELRSTGGRTLYHLDDRPIPVARLARLLGLTERHEGSPWVTLAVVRGAGERVALVCQRLLGARDLVLRPLPIELQSLRLISAAAVLPSGQAIFVLSPRALVEVAGELRDDGRTRASGAADQRADTILIADDSITTRSLLRNALESSGFRVRTAADGEEALRLAVTEPIALVVSDVRMPRIDGFELTARLRADSRTARVPVVLFSSLESEADKRRGSDSGANAYLTKGAFDRGQLLDVVTSLLRGT